MQPSAADRTNQQMVDRLIAEGVLWSRPVIAAFRATPRHRFLDRVFKFVHKDGRWHEILLREPTPAHLRLIYSDRALVTGLHRDSRTQSIIPISSSSQPSLMAQMLQDLRPEPGLRVLEVGTGTGYNAALLAHVAGSGRVVSIDVDRDVLSQAWEHLRGFPERQVRLAHADGRCGFAEAAPYDRIMVTAASLDLEPAWLEQSADGGLLQVPLALAPGLEFIAQGQVHNGVFDGRLIRAAYFMTLRAEDEAGAARPARPTPPSDKGGRTFPAPWAGWFDRRRPRVSWLGFCQALAFLGWLRGLGLHHQPEANDQFLYGVSDPERPVWCWLGSQEWQVSDDAGRDLGLSLWNTFLEMGGPWPTEYRFRASAAQPLPASDPRGYSRQGPLCRQRWELLQARERAAWL
jgi:protein-L-isoaspartate(D-aspartate) O-methyltransferase